ncbi:unnamed protein product [Linum trigynum]|uniref:TIR domain-containing protein n=1 Tax=Linum trigynum TaxID=586398 RepID=A0AAV2ENX0_9ROSI
MSTLFLHLLLFAVQLLLFTRLLRRRFTSALPPATASTTPATVPSPPQPRYIVFISFRGHDVCDTFFSHLHNHLSRHKKILTYMDDADLARGQSISASLSTTIESSTVYVVILSPNYVGSRWCLDELVTVLECEERYDKRVISVFYGGVGPGDVGEQRGKYGEEGSILRRCHCL